MFGLRYRGRLTDENVPLLNSVVKKVDMITRCPDDHCAGDGLTCGPLRDPETGNIILNRYGRPYCWQCEKPTIEVEKPSYLEGFENDSTLFSSYESYKKYMDEYLKSLQK